jgi:glyoxylase-like metal-dependent hydrolase (beta-lactamase superfamily II)
MRKLSVGQARVSIFNVGDFIWNLSEKFNISRDEWFPDNAAYFTQPQLFPTQSIHVALPNASILIDPCHHDISPGLLSILPDYQQPPDLISQLLASGIRPEEVTHVVITHTHLDHYASITREEKGAFVPTFPNARCFLGRAEWEDSAMQQAIQDTSSPEWRTLGVLRQHRLLELVEDTYEPVPEVKIIPAPGETPGHQIVQVHSEGQTLYCLGDLYHHQVEFEHPTWMVHWIDIETNLSSRSALMKRVWPENALLVPSHVPVGHLEHTVSGIKWENNEKNQVSDGGNTKNA